MKVFQLLALTVAALGCVSCADDEMADQPRYEAMEPSGLFADGTSARVPPAGTIARGRLEIDSAAETGVDPATGVAVLRSPLPFTAERLQKGRELFGIHCAVCHGSDGYGRGIIVRRGFPQPPSYHSARLREAPDGHFFDVITHGYGKMYPFRGRIAARDRWAIVGYIRALQRSQDARLADVDDAAERRQLVEERSRR